MAVFRQQGTACCVLLESGKAVEVMREAGLPSMSAGLNRHDLVLGKVRQVLPVLAAAFVDIGDTHDALLPLAAAPPDICSGQTLILQISKRTPEHKGHCVTSQLALPGPYAVFLPHAAPLRRSKLRELPESSQETLFLRDLRRLEQLWQAVRQDAASGPVPRRLHAFGDPCHMALITWTGRELARIRVEDQTVYQSVYRHLADMAPEFLPLLHFQRPQGDIGLAALLGLSDLDKQMTRRQVQLDQGGSILLDQGEALTAIDVNSGRDIRGRDTRALRLRTNLQAAEEAAHQLRLRNIGGMVVIDFLRMKEAGDRQLVDSRLRELLARDRARSKIYGYTAMGLYELLRTAF